MKQYKQPAFWTLSVLVICVILQPIFYNTISLLHTINLTFLFSALFLFVGFFLAMVAVGTFDSTQFLLNHLFQKRSTSSISSTNQSKSTNHWSQKVGKSYLLPLNVGFTLFVLCMMLLAVYYLF